MLGYMLKNLPSKYVYAGYSIRKSLTIMTSNINGRIVYDVFLYTYVDNYLSFIYKWIMVSIRMLIIILWLMKQMLRI